MTWLKRVGLTLLAIGLVSVLVVFVLPAAHNWTPVRMPISLASGTLTSPEFRTDLDTNYEINIEVDRKIDPEKLDCLLGNQAFFLKPCKTVPNLIDISWTVASHGQTIVTGSSDDVHLGANRRTHHWPFSSAQREPVRSPFECQERRVRTQHHKSQTHNFGPPQGIRKQHDLGHAGGLSGVAFNSLGRPLACHLWPGTRLPKTERSKFT
jgi:hypothetical protein